MQLPGSPLLNTVLPGKRDVHPGVLGECAHVDFAHRSPRGRKACPIRRGLKDVNPKDVAQEWRKFGVSHKRAAQIALTVIAVTSADASGRDQCSNGQSIIRTQQESVMKLRNTILALAVAALGVGALMSTTSSADARGFGGGFSRGGGIHMGGGMNRGGHFGRVGNFARFAIHKPIFRTHWRHYRQWHSSKAA